MMNSIAILEPLRQRRARLESLANQIKALERKRGELQRALADHKAFQPEHEKGTIDSLEITATDLSKQMAAQEVSKANLDRRLQSANAAKVSPLVVWKYFTADQKQIRAESSCLAVELSSTKQNLLRDQEALSGLRADINTSRKHISDYENFDLNSSEKRLSSLGTEIERLKAGHAASNAELVRIEKKICPHTKELDRLKSELATLIANVTRANRLEQELSSAR